MKKGFLLTLFLLLILRGVTSAQNIYESIGKEAKVLTLSNGKYQEFFTNDTIVRIGTVLLNTKTKEIVEFVSPNDSSTFAEADVASRFLSVDPIGREYPELTPYQFASNRPIQGIDLDGLEFFNTIAKRVAKSGLKKVTKEFIKDEIGDRLKNYTSKKWASQLLDDADKAMTIADDGWIEIVGETIIEQIPYAGPAYSVYDFAKENKKLWDALSFIGDKAEKYAGRLDEVKNSFTTLYGKIPKANIDLRNSLGLTDGDGFQAHHIIPTELFKRDDDIGNFVQNAVAGGFNFNQSGNGIGLPKTFHSGSHGKYTNQIEAKISSYGDLSKFTPEQASNMLQSITTDVKQQLDKAKDGAIRINDFKLK